MAVPAAIAVAAAVAFRTLQKHLVAAVARSRCVSSVRGSGGDGCLGAWHRTIWRTDVRRRAPEVAPVHAQAAATTRARMK